MSSQARTLLLPVLLALALPSSAAGEQPPTGAGGGRAGGGRVFDPATVRTVSGEVAEVRRIPRGTKYAGVHLTLATAQEQLDVHLGPEWFVDERLPKLAKGDRLEVKGSEVRLDGKPALIAQEIRRADARVVLRNDAGVPAWSRRGKR